MARLKDCLRYIQDKKRIKKKLITISKFNLPLLLNLIPEITLTKSALKLE